MIQARLKGLFVIALTLAFFSSSSAAAVPCEDIVGSYNRQIKKHKDELKKYEKALEKFNSANAKAERVRLSEERNQKSRFCFERAKEENTIKDRKKAEEKCKIEAFNLALRAHQSVPSSTQSRETLDIAQRIVLNNKKCFDPVLVAEIQRARG